MKWPINPNKHRSLRKHADEISNLGLNIMTRWGCVSCRQSTKVGIVNCFTDQIMPCCDRRVRGPLHEKNFYPAVRVRLKETQRHQEGVALGEQAQVKQYKTSRHVTQNPPTHVDHHGWEKERKKWNKRVAKKRKEIHTEAEKTRKNRKQSP